ncbi:hypothetical protein L211DRAFT_799026 [Terfezia boudieri ATCC MYA-4762]|uniref:Uncharacterized protein n=1 Tax=Terfezia boudieri ATCC MYA-4762 TaxID=1051890 RepID=A0A3N4L610_9PEZI|nr:hypothetical protein L211DRAFT_799026 [Terfezia boudieri ATCC MYA-4762]
MPITASDVYFNPANIYSKRSPIRAQVVALVIAATPTIALYAIVVNGWHRSRTDKRNHITVEWYDANNRMTRDHIV